jgi:hypothetical protein
VKLNRPDEVPAESDAFTLITALGKGLHNLFESGSEETFESEGLLFTPDEVVPGEGHNTVVEFKTTRYSARKGLSEMGSYVEQIAGYCALLGVRHARLHILHLVGDYKNPTPVHRCFDVEFEERELAWWKGEILRRRDMIQAAESMEAIPLAEHQTWECKYCPLLGGACPGGDGERRPAFPHVEMIEEE